MPSSYFARLDDQGNYQIFELEGDCATRLPDAPDGVFPAGANLSVRYEHERGITLSPEDARRCDIWLEDEVCPECRAQLSAGYTHQMSCSVGGSKGLRFSAVRSTGFYI